MPFQESPDIKPIGGTVFVKRNEDVEELCGMEISQGALTKNLLGRITAVRENDHVEIGDVIHLPHYGVTDAEYGGQEYAIIEQDDLFLKYVDGEPQPINRYVHVRKCVNEHYKNDDGEIFLHKTDEAIEHTNWVEIINVSDDCRNLAKIDIGTFCSAPENDDRLRRIEYTKDFMLHEDLITFTNEGD